MLFPFLLPVLPVLPILLKWIGLTAISLSLMGNILGPPVPTLPATVAVPPAAAFTVPVFVPVLALPAATVTVTVSSPVPPAPTVTVIVATPSPPIVLDLEPACPLVQIEPIINSTSVLTSHTCPVRVGSEEVIGKGKGIPSASVPSHLSALLPSLSSLIWLALGVIIGRWSRRSTPATIPVAVPTVNLVSVPVSPSAVDEDVVFSPRFVAGPATSSEVEMDAAAIVTVASPCAGPAEAEVVNSWSIAPEVVFDDVFAEAPAAVEPVEPVSLETAEVEDELVAEELVATVEQVAFEAPVDVDAMGSGGMPSGYSRTPFIGRLIAPDAPSAIRTGDFGFAMRSDNALVKAKGSVHQINLLGRFQEMATPSTAESRASVKRTPVVSPNNPFWGEAERSEVRPAPSSARISMLNPGEGSPAVDLDSPLSMRQAKQKQRSKIPIPTGAISRLMGSNWPSANSPLAPMRLGSSLRPSSLRNERTEEMGAAELENAPSVRELRGAAPENEAVEEEKPVRVSWPVQKLVDCEVLHAQSVRKSIIHTTSSMTGKYVRPCETNFSPGSPSERQAAKYADEPPSPTPGSGRRGGMTPGSNYKPPAKRRLESLRNP